VAVQVRVAGREADLVFGHEPAGGRVVPARAVVVQAGGRVHLAAGEAVAVVVAAGRVGAVAEAVVAQLALDRAGQVGDVADRVLPVAQVPAGTAGGAGLHPVDQ